MRYIAVIPTCYSAHSYVCAAPISVRIVFAIVSLRVKERLVCVALPIFQSCC